MSSVFKNPKMTSLSKKRESAIPEESPIQIFDFRLAVFMQNYFAESAAEPQQPQQQPQ